MEGLSSRVGRVAAVCHTGPITLIGTSDDGQVPGNRCLAAEKRGDSGWWCDGRLFPKKKVCGAIES
jgi:hypothetical protein